MNIKRSAWASHGNSLQRGDRLFNGLAARSRRLVYLSAPDEHVGWGGIVVVSPQPEPPFSSEPQGGTPDGYYLFQFGLAGGLLDLTQITMHYPLSVCLK